MVHFFLNFSYLGEQYGRVGARVVSQMSTSAGGGETDSIQRVARGHCEAMPSVTSPKTKYIFSIGGGIKNHKCYHLISILNFGCQEAVKRLKREGGSLPGDNVGNISKTNVYIYVQLGVEIRITDV